MSEPLCPLFNDHSIRPEDYNTRDYNKGDCTTRAMTYVLKGIMTYKEIEAEQYRLAHILRTRRNTCGTWDRVLKDFGFSWLQFETTIPRGSITKLLKVSKEPILTLSRTHVAVAHNGQVVDTWDSTRGRVYAILVSDTEIEQIARLLSANGYDTKKVATPSYKVQRRMSHRWYW